MCADGRAWHSMSGTAGRIYGETEGTFAEITDWRLTLDGDPTFPEPQGVIRGPKQPASMLRGFIKPNRRERRARMAKDRLTKRRRQAQ